MVPTQFRFFFMTVVCWLLLVIPARAVDLSIVFEDYPPFEYVEEGEVRGVNLELIREAFKRMDVNVFFEPRPWKRAVYQLKSGEVMALSSGFKTPEREKFAYFGAPLAQETNVVLSLKETGVRVNSLNDLHGLRVGVVNEYVYSGGFEELQGLDKVYAHSTHQMVRMLLNRRVDVIVGSREVFRYLLEKLDAWDQVTVQHKISHEPLYIFFSKARGEAALKMAEQFGRTIKAMHRDGTFDKILSHY